MEHDKLETLAGQTSELEKILAKLSPKVAPTQGVSHAEVNGASASSLMAIPNETPRISFLPQPAEIGVQEDKTAELLRLKQELLAANSKIALQEQELAQTRVIKHTLDQALGPPSEADFSGREITEQTLSHLQSAFNASNPTYGSFQDSWSTQEDSQSDVSDALSAGAYNRARGLWNQQGQSPFSINTNGHSLDRAYGEIGAMTNPVGQDSSRCWGASSAYPGFTAHGGLQPQRVLSGPSAGTYSFYSRPPNEQSHFLPPAEPASRRPITNGNRNGTFLANQATPWGGFVAGPSNGAGTTKSPSSPITRPSSTFPAIGVFPVTSYHARPATTALSPTATEFTTVSANGASWASSSVRTLSNHFYSLGQILT